MPPESKSKEKEKMKLAYADRSNHVWMQYTEIGYWPASVNVWLNVCPGTSSGLKFGEESNLPFGVPFSPDVTVCSCASSFVHVTVAPMLT